MGSSIASDCFRVSPNALVGPERDKAAKGIIIGMHPRPEEFGKHSRALCWDLHSLGLLESLLGGIRRLSPGSARAGVNTVGFWCKQALLFLGEQSLGQIVEQRIQCTA